MSSLTIISVIVGVFVVFAVRYFIKNNIANSQQRKATQIASFKLIFYLPVFLQGLFLVWICVVNFFFFCRAFFEMLNSLGGAPAIAKNNAGAITVVITSSLLLGFNFLLAKMSSESNKPAAKICLKILYLFYSYWMLFILFENKPFMFLLFSTRADVFFYLNNYVLAATAIIIVLLFVSMYSKSLNRIKWLRYLQLPLKISLLYAVVCFTIALGFFLLCLLCRFLS